MKWLIASDIHGSAAYCRRLTEALERERADRLLLLGDLLYHGPRNPLPEGHDPMAVAQMLNELPLPVLAVRGNCDAEIDQAVLTFPMMADYILMEISGHTVFVTHGHLFSPEKRPPMRPGELFLSGHTHVPLCRAADGLVFLNPGSLALPKEGSPHSYLTLEEGLFLWKDCDGREFMRYQAEG